jgi:outer membrane protein OmpA-like peptidoglycan-associated protein
VAGKRYRVSFWVSIADKSPHAVATLSALLTKQRAEDTARGILMNREERELGEHESQSIAIYYTPQVTHDPSHPLDNNRHWEEVSGEFVAEGGELFLTIGNFLPFNKSNVVPTGVNSPLQGAYYYIDDVSLFCLDSIDEEKPNTLPDVGKVVRLENLYFATGESTVLQQSYKELHALLTLLSENPSIHIELRGHTDNQGTIEYNQKLSEKRAKAVADYLVKRGIERNRIKWVGFGKSAPVATNDTPEGRRQNRRVEYVVIAR